MSTRRSSHSVAGDDRDNLRGAGCLIVVNEHVLRQHRTDVPEVRRCLHVSQNYEIGEALASICIHLVDVPRRTTHTCLEVCSPKCDFHPADGRSYANTTG